MYRMMYVSYDAGCQHVVLHKINSILTCSVLHLIREMLLLNMLKIFRSRGDKSDIREPELGLYKKAVTGQILRYSCSVVLQNCASIPHRFKLSSLPYHIL